MNNFNKKTLIQIGVTALCFLGSGFVLYNGYFKKTIRPVASSAIDLESMTLRGKTETKAPKNIEQILPNGIKLDFEVLNRPNVQYGTTLWENSVADSEVGVLQNNMIVSKSTVE